jgi:hypothetical protein
MSRVANRRESFTAAMILILNIRTGLKVCVTREKSAIHSSPVDEGVSNIIRRHLRQNRSSSDRVRGVVEVDVRGGSRCQPRSGVWS